MNNWNQLSVDSFVRCVSQRSFKRQRRVGENDRWEIKPTMSLVYWGLLEQGDYLPPSQGEFVHEVSRASGQQIDDRFRYRVGYRTYGALVRQHHFALMLVERLGCERVVFTPFMDTHYKTDILVFDALCRVHGVHLSTNSETARRYARSQFSLAAIRQHDLRLRLDERDGPHAPLRVGRDDQFLLHPDADLDDLVHAIESCDSPDLTLATTR